MPSRRFYAADLAAPIVSLDKEDAWHAQRVLRLNIGDRVKLFDGIGNLADGKVAELGRVVRVEIDARRSEPPIDPPIDLAAAVPKGSRADTLVEKISELGATRWMPLICRRSVVEPGHNKVERFRRQAVESAKQCGRAWMLQVVAPRPFDQIISSADHDLKLIADTRDGAESQALRGLPSSVNQAKRIIVLIGPEGGWEDDEREAACAAGFAPWRLGPHVMRIETAAAAALAILRQDS